MVIQVECLKSSTFEAQTIHEGGEGKRVNPKTPFDDFPHDGEGEAHLAQVGEGVDEDAESDEGGFRGAL